MTSVLIRRGSFGQKDIQQRKSCEDRGRDWSDAGVSPRNTKDCWQKPETWKKQSIIFSQSLQRKDGPANTHLDFRLLASKTLREYLSVVLSHPVCDNVLHQTLKTNTPNEVESEFIEGF